MKNKEKEIEEMSREICSEYDCVIPCQSCGYYGYANCRDVKSAEKLYIAGYRKASDVAREIFEEIEKLMNKLDKRHIACGNPKQAWGVRSAMTELAELKKKYESEEN